MSNIPAILSALDAFSNATDKTSIEYANNWLQEFQHSPEAWSTCNILLFSDEFPFAVKLFSAQTFRTKITYDLEQVEENQLDSLRNTLIEALEKYLLGPKAIIIQLSLALSGLALQFSDWKNVVESIIDRFGKNFAAVPALLEFLTVLPEDVTGNTRVSISNEEYRKRSFELLSESTQRVLELLTLYMTAPGITHQIQVQILYCLRSWLISGEITALTSKELFDAAVDVICDLIHETQELGDNVSAIEQIVSKLIHIKPLLSSVKHEPEKIRGYARIFSEAGEVYRNLMLQHPETFFPIIEAIGECTSYPDLDIVPITFHFWMRLAQSIGKSPNIPVPFLDAYKTLMGVIINHLRFPSDEDSLSSQETEEFRSFRHVMGDTLKDCCYVLGSEVYLTIVYNLIMSAISKDSSNAMSVSWQDIEAPLFSLRSVGAEIDPSDDRVFPKILDLLPALPNNKRVHYAAILVIARYSEWTNKHPNYIPYLLQFISAGFISYDSELSAAAAQAMKYLCQDCRHHMIPYLPRLQSLIISAEFGLMQEDKLQIYEAVAHVISAMPMEQAAQTLRSFSFSILSRIKNITLKSDNVTKDEIQDVTDNLENLDVMLNVTQFFGEQLSSTCQNACEEAWAILNSLLSMYSGRVEVCERTTRVICHGLKLFGLRSKTCSLPVLEQMSNFFDYTGYSSYIWTAGKVIGTFGRENDLTLHLSFKSTFERFTQKIFGLLQENAPHDIPDVIEDYLQFLLQLVKFVPTVLFESTAFAMSCRTALLALSLIHSEIVLSSLEFLKAVVTDECLRRGQDSALNGMAHAVAIKQAMDSIGLQLCEKILSGLNEDFPEEAIPMTITIFREMCIIWPSQLQLWLLQISDQLQTAASFANAKHQFVTKIIRAIGAGDIESVKPTLLELRRFSIRIRERCRITQA